MRFVIVGGLVMTVYVSLTTLLLAAGLPSQAALAIGYVTAVSLHFTLYRHVVFAEPAGYALSPAAQARRFLLVTTAQYVVTALSLGLLPSTLGVSRIAVYLATALVVSSVTFVVMRLALFHPPTHGQRAP